MRNQGLLKKNLRSRFVDNIFYKMGKEIFLSETLCEQIRNNSHDCIRK